MCFVLKFISKKSNKKHDETRVTSVAGVVEFTDTSVQLFTIRRVGYMHSLYSYRCLLEILHITNSTAHS